jgi:hypothetical protein
LDFLFPVHLLSPRVACRPTDRSSDRARRSQRVDRSVCVGPSWRPKAVTMPETEPVPRDRTDRPTRGPASILVRRRSVSSGTGREHHHHPTEAVCRASAGVAPSLAAAIQLRRTGPPPDAVAGSPSLLADRRPKPLPRYNWTTEPAAPSCHPKTTREMRFPMPTVSQSRWRRSQRRSTRSDRLLGRRVDPFHHTRGRRRRSGDGTRCARHGALQAAAPSPGRARRGSGSYHNRCQLL